MQRIMDAVQTAPNGGSFTVQALATTGQFPILASGSTLSTFANRLFLSPANRVGLSYSNPYEIPAGAVVIPFIIRIAGVYTSANASGTLQLALHQNTTAVAGAVVASWAASPAVSTGSENFFMEIDACWDSTSLAINGNAWGNQGGAVIAVSSIVPISSVTTLGVMNLSLAAVLAHTSLADNIQLSEFSFNLL